MASARRLRVGVLGAVTWARAAHLPGFARDARAELVAIADPVSDLARQTAAEFGIPHVHHDHRELLARGDLDLVDVCTPSHTHFELAWAALEAGCHVLCEKPVAYDFRETRRAAAFARQKGLKTKLGFTFRFFGAGVQPPAASWGSMLYQAQTAMTTEPWLAIFPGAFIVISVMAVTVLTDEAGRS